MLIEHIINKQGSTKKSCLISNSSVFLFFSKI